jgi:hypothetical protein
MTVQGSDIVLGVCQRFPVFPRLAFSAPLYSRGSWFRLFYLYSRLFRKRAGMRVEDHDEYES